MSDSGKMSEGHSSSDEENKMKETSKVSDSEDSKTSTSSQSASDSEAAAKSAFIRSSPILYRQLKFRLSDRNPRLVKMLTSDSSNVSSSEDLVTIRKNFNTGYSNLKDKDTKKSLKRNFDSVSETAVDKSESSHPDEYSLPAKKPLFDESNEKVMSPPESQASTSKTRQIDSDVLPGSTGNIGSSASNIISESTKYNQDSNFPVSSTERHTRQDAMPSSATGHQISGELQLETEAPSLSVRTENDDSTTNGNNATAREQCDEGSNGVRPPNFSGNREIQNILHLFEYLLNEFYILESYLDEQQVIPEETPAEEEVAGPSCSSTASGRQLATISAESDAGSKQTAQSTCSGCDKVNVPEIESETHANRKESENEKEPPRASAGGSEATAIQENTIDTSLGEPSNLDLNSKKGAKPNPEVDNLDRPSEILPALQLLIAEAQNLLFQCIEATESITSICHEQGANRPHREIERHIADILDKLHQLVQIRKECAALFAKCRNRNEIAGVTCILEIKTHIAQAYNRLLNDVLALKDLFHQNIPSKPKSDSDD